MNFVSTIIFYLIMVFRFSHEPDEFAYPYAAAAVALMSPCGSWHGR